MIIELEELVKNEEIEIKTGPFGTQLKAAEYVESGTPVLNVKNLGYSTVVTTKVDYVGEKTLERLSMHILKEGDIVFGRKGAVDRHAYIGANEAGWMQGSDCIRLRVKTNKINPRYLSYYFLTPKHKAFMISMCSHGTTMASLNQGILSKIEIDLPERCIQDRIVSIIEVLDKKRKTNEKLNKNLEQQAQTIYQQMFIDNASSDWTEGTLSDIANIIMGQSPSGSSYNEDGNGTIFFQGRAEFGFRFPTVRLYTTEPKRMACANDTLMSVRAPVGDLNVAHIDCCIGRGLAAIHSKNNHQSFVLYTMFSLKKQLDVFNGEGTVFGSINRNSLNEMPILIPSSEKLDEFEALVAPMDAVIRNNYDEICRLERLRDSLLPKLMSGELDVSGIDL